MVCDGDGTISAVAGLLAGTHATLGIIPCGRGIVVQCSDDLLTYAVWRQSRAQPRMAGCAHWREGWDMPAGGCGIVGDIVIGMVGAVLGGFLAGTLLNIPDAMTGINVTSIFVAFIGSVILILLMRGEGRGQVGSSGAFCDAWRGGKTKPLPPRPLAACASAFR